MNILKVHALIKEQGITNIVYASVLIDDTSRPEVLYVYHKRDGVFYETKIKTEPRLEVISEVTPLDGIRREYKLDQDREHMYLRIEFNPAIGGEL